MSPPRQTLNAIAGSTTIPSQLRNAVGHRGYDWIKRPPHNDNFHQALASNFGCAFYFDHSYKSYAFNNIAWGTNNDVDDEYYSASGFYESFGILNHWFHNTVYNMAIGQTKTWRDSADSRYFGNLYLDIGYAYIFNGVPGSAEAAGKARRERLGLLAFVSWFGIQLGCDAD